MIPETELRVGNWYRQLNSGELSQVTLFLLGEIADDESYLDHLMPISLCATIFKKCGFEKSDDEYGGWLSPPIHRDQPNTFYQIRFREDAFGYYYEGSLIRRIKYLHQMQNVFFWLSEKEIEFKP